MWPDPTACCHCQYGVFIIWPAVEHDMLFEFDAGHVNKIPILSIHICLMISIGDLHNSVLKKIVCNQNQFNVKA